MSWKGKSPEKLFKSYLGILIATKKEIKKKNNNTDIKKHVGRKLKRVL